MRISHEQEIEEMKERVLHLKQRAKSDLDEYQEDLQFERQRRITDLQRQHEEHEEAMQTLKLEYSSALEKIKDSMSNAEFDPEKCIDELLSFRSNLFKSRYDFLEFYIQLLRCLFRVNVLFSFFSVHLLNDRILRIRWDQLNQPETFICEILV